MKVTCGSFKVGKGKYPTRNGNWVSDSATVIRRGYLDSEDFSHSSGTHERMITNDFGKNPENVQNRKIR